MWTKSYGVTIQMKATEQYSPVVLFIMLYKVVLTILYVNEILWCDHSNESSSLLFSHGAVFFVGISQNEILTYCDDTKQWNVENELRRQSRARTLIERYNLKESVLVLVKRDLILSCFSTTVKGPLNCSNCVWQKDLHR